MRHFIREILERLGIGIVLYGVLEYSHKMALIGLGVWVISEAYRLKAKES